MVHAPASGSGDCHYESLYNPACDIAYAGCCFGILLPALAKGMAQPGTCDDRLTSAHMGMDIVLYCDLAYGTTKGNRTTAAKFDTEFPLLTSSVIVATLLAWPEEADIRWKDSLFISYI